MLKTTPTPINKKEYVALMGTSGSGKSTLMNIIGCLDTPSKGSYYLNNKNVGELSDNKLSIKVIVSEIFS